MQDNLYYIEIDKDLIPYRFDITLGNSVYFMEFRYNRTFDFFTVDLLNEAEEPLVFGEPLVYGKQLFEDMDDIRFPVSRLVPLDLSGVESRITFDNLNKTVFLYDLSETNTPEEGEAT
ncbi:phage baseplate plug protein [Exiguobacterium aestuarii]|uniref:phage baseplate plug family protein n=1 Tax=Exiguobacterium aestuarii TaxID=273527 RepID=UPI001CD31991|nr:hypothetical protein [Exiguobacterium aestuarii]MCA0980243.1 hypothetical protein [Exiguobacterium aestuarii]